MNGPEWDDAFDIDELRAFGVDALLRAAASRWPDRVALSVTGEELTYRELDDRSDRAACALTALGVRTGDRVAISATNQPGVVELFLATMRIGAVWVGISPALARPEQEFIISDSRPSLLLTGLSSPMEQSPSSECRLVRLDGPEWLTKLDSAPPARWDESDPLAPAAIAYSSGTTGYPKGAVHSQHNMLMVAAAQRSTGRLRPWRYGCPFPVVVLNMVALAVVVPLASGGSCHLTTRTGAPALSGWIAEQQIQVLHTVPTLLYDLVHSDVPPDDLGSLTEVIVGGTEPPEAVLTAFARRYHVRPTCAYGTTESLDGIAWDPPADDHRPGSSGRPFPTLRVSIRDERGSELPVGHDGEICISGTSDFGTRGDYSPMLGYWNQPAATAAALSGGVLHTGDIGCLDPDGHLFVRGRIADVIVRGGANVYPAEVERVLEQHEDVVASAVVAKPDARLGQVVVAAVEVPEGATVDAHALREFCLERMARYKVPTEIRIVSRLPRSSTAKIRRGEVAGLFESGA